MSDETTTTTETQTQEASTQEQTPGIFSDASTGTLSPDFANYLGEDAASFADDLNQRFGGQPLGAMAKSWKEAQKTISEGGRTLGYPGADASEAEIDKWVRANGVPQEAKDYDIRPEDAPDYFNDEIADKFKEVFARHRVPPALAQAMTKEYLGIEQELAREVETRYQNQLEAAQRDLQKRLGPEYQERINNAKAMVASQGYDPNDPELFDNPKMVGFLTDVVSLLGEDTVASMREAAGTTGVLAGDGKGEANRIMTDPNHPDHEKYRRGDADVAAKVTRLLGQG